MSASGAFTFVLHGHLPYQPDPDHWSREADPGRWSHSGKTFYQTVTETYLPLLQTLHNLKSEAVPFRLTLCLSPLLIEQLARPAVIAQLKVYLADRIAAAQHDIAYFDPDTGVMPAPHLHYLAQWHLDWYEQIAAALKDDFDEDLVGAFKLLQDEGFVELAATAATHAYLPLLGHDSAVRAQINTGLASYERIFGRRPSAFWLPDCGYRPGLETFLLREGLRAIFVEPHMMTNTPPIGVAAGDVQGPLNEIKLRYMIPWTQQNPNNGVTTIQPYKLNAAPELALIGRDDRATMQVWGAINGYPLDVDYLERGRYFGPSELPYWRITGDLVDPHDKDQYHPDWAKYKVEQHAEHFAHMIGDMIREYHESTGQFGIISTHIDVRLFGHWWTEGVRWLGQVLRHLSTTPSVDQVSASQFLAEHAPQQAIDLAEGSWGTGGGHFIWKNPATEWVWPLIHEAEARMEALVKQLSKASDDEAAVLAQAARELLLLQSGDWLLMMTLDKDRDYAIQRFDEHLERFSQLAASLEAAAPDLALAEEYGRLDQVFPEVDYRAFDKA